MNRFVGVGRLTKDVDLRYLQSGKAVGNFTIAINRPFKNKNGDYEADFINVVQFGKGAENLANYMKKGSQIGVDGRIQTRTFETKDGKTMRSEEHTSELQSRFDLVGRLLLEKKKNRQHI